MGKQMNRVAEIMYNELKRKQEMEYFLDSERQEAREEGLVEGRAEANLINLKNLMKNMNLTLPQAMSALGLPPEEEEQYASKL